MSDAVRSITNTDPPVVRIERAARFGEPSLPAMRVNLAPMIDVVFLLLVYFLLASQFRPPERALALDVPAGETTAPDPFALPATPVTIRVRSTGPELHEASVSVEHPRFAGADLGPADLVTALVADRFGPDQEFRVLADDARWEHTVLIVSGLREAGFLRVSLDADRPMSGTSR